MGRAARRRAEQRRAAPTRRARAPQTPQQAPALGFTLARRPQDEGVAPSSAPNAQQPNGGPTLLSAAYDPRLVSVGRLAALHADRVRLDAEIDLLVDRLAARGTGWGEIGRALGISRQGARQRYG